MENIMKAAERPTMGWNSFDCYGWSVTEEEFRQNVDCMADRLKDYGWEYAVLDFCWYTPGRDCEPNPNQDKNGNPRLAMDEYGRLIPSEDRFPSAKGGKGLKPLADYVHEKGLKFGLHIMRGVPRQAVMEKTVIKGTDITADQIADKEHVCEWLNYMYGCDMEKAGAQEYLDSLFELYASWGVDYIKIDDLSRPYAAAEIEGCRRAIIKCGRNMVMSTSPGATPLEMGEHISKYADMWRICKDFWDEWEMLKRQFAYFHDWTPFRRPGSFPDGDMLPLGHLSLYGPMGEPRRSRFTEGEKRIMMSLWGIGRSPLMMGGNLPDNEEETWALLTNKDVIRMNQYGCDPRQIYSDKERVIWYSDDENGQSHYLAVFNISEKDADIQLTLPAACAGKIKVIRDVWEKTERPAEKFASAVRIHSHDVKLYVLKG